jgi:hypothetical protein
MMGSRETLFEAALVLMTHSRKWSWLKAWGTHQGVSAFRDAPHPVDLA